MEKRPGTDDNVYVQRVDGSGTTLWSTQGSPMTRAGLQQLFPQLVDTFGNDVVAVWMDSRSGIDDDLYANALGYSGATAGVPPSPFAGARLALASTSPAHGVARVRLTLADAATVSVAVVDAGGRQVRALAHGVLEAGTHVLEWDGRDAARAAVAAGVYFVEARIGGETRAVRVVELR